MFCFVKRRKVIGNQVYITVLLLFDANTNPTYVCVDLRPTSPLWSEMATRASHTKSPRHYEGENSDVSSLHRRPNILTSRGMRAEYEGR